MIYFDHNATAPLHPSVQEVAQEALTQYFANPSSPHHLGQKSRAVIEQARKKLSELLHCKPHELVFTASATEANVMALWGHWWAQNSASLKKKILLSPLEHSSVYENVLYLKEKAQADIVFMPLTSQGIIDIPKVEEMLDSDVWAFCSLIAAQNESGVIQPWQEVAELCQKFKVPFHTDCVQLFGRVPFSISSAISTATLAFHKAGGLKGLGLLVVRSGVLLDPLIRGGGQEQKRRAGTENIAAICGAAALAEKIPELITIHSEHILPLRNQFEKMLLERIPTAKIVGKECERLPNTSYVIFPHVRSDALLMNLDLEDVCVSSGSACSSGMILPSRTLRALGYSEEEATHAIRFSLGPKNTLEEVVKVVGLLEKAVLKQAA